MVKLFRAELTSTGRPVLLHGEVERGMLDKVNLVFYGIGGVEERPAEEYKDGYVVLTNYRLIWLNSEAAASSEEGEGGGVPCHLPLPAVSAAEHKGGRLITNARLKLMVRVDAASYPTQDSRSMACMAPLKLVCKGPSPDTLHSQLNRALQGQAWASAPTGLLQQLYPAPLLSATSGGATPGRVGPSPLGEGLRRTSAAAASGAGGSAADGGGFQPDWAVVQGLCAASFTKLQAVNAVVATRNAGVQQAVEWILDNQGSPALDHPSPYLVEQSGGSGSSRVGGSVWMGPSSDSTVPAYGSIFSSAAQPTHAAGTSFTNPLLAGQQGSSGWDLLGTQQSGGSGIGSGWEILNHPGASSTLSGSLPGSGSLAAAGMGSGSGSLYGSGPMAATSAGLPMRMTPASGAGVSLILKREEQKAAATETAMDAAFRDLDQLMRKAGEMVQLAQYFKERVAVRKDGAGAEGGEEELDAETALDLLNLGIVSPVTRETAGSLYHQELSRQLADFLRVPMDRASGMMPLPDVYCLYNRARGTELISPDDLLTAIKLFPKIHAPYTLREFASGVKVVQAASHSDEAVCRRLAAMVQPQPLPQTDAGTAGASAAAAADSTDGATVSTVDGHSESTELGTASSSAAVAEVESALVATLGPSITRTEVAVALGVPVPVAGEHLHMAEARGVLCRDDGPEGLRFFRNFFPDAAATAAVGS